MNSACRLPLKWNNGRRRLATATEEARSRFVDNHLKLICQQLLAGVFREVSQPLAFADDRLQCCALSSIHGYGSAPFNSPARRAPVCPKLFQACTGDADRIHPTPSMMAP